MFPHPSLLKSNGDKCWTLCSSYANCLPCVKPSACQPASVMLVSCARSQSLGHVMRLYFLRAASGGGSSSSTVQLVTPLQWVMVYLTGASVTTCRRSQRTEQSHSGWGALCCQRDKHCLRLLLILLSLVERLSAEPLDCGLSNVFSSLFDKHPLTVI